jgi:hypothetical protein
MKENISKLVLAISLAVPLTGILKELDIHFMWKMVIAIVNMMTMAYSAYELYKYYNPRIG